MSREYKIFLLKKSKKSNIQTEEIQGLFILDKYWLVTIGKVFQLNNVYDLLMNTINTTTVTNMNSNTVDTNNERKNDELKFEKYELYIADWHEKNVSGYKIIRLKCEL